MQTLYPRALLVLLATLTAGAAETITVKPETPAQRDERMEWFREARFGMFIHWGLYSILAGEYQGKPVQGIGEWIQENAKIPVSEYEKLAPQFNPTKYNARDWVRTAKNAGMKYIVITSKHHDGFGLWRSQLTDWCMTSTPSKRDLLKELADACNKEDIRLCFYHSIMDWHHPDWGTRRPWHDKATNPPDMDRYVPYLKGQLKELLTGYGPIGIAWFDGEWEKAWTHERGVDLYNYVKELQPKIIINNRIGKGRAGMSGMDQGAQRVGDYGTPEQEIPATGFGPGVDWESCMTMNDTWGFKKNDHNWKSTETLVRNLIDCASKGGNYLLNVGPTAEGLIPQPSIERLAAIGDWMKVNRETIYATSASPFKRLPWGRCTRKETRNGATLYLHVFNWPADGKLLVPGLKNPVQKAYLLAGNKALQTAPSDAGLTVSLPPAAPDPISSTVVLRVKGPLEIEQQAGLNQDPSGTLSLPAAEARLHGSDIKYEAGNQRDSLGFWTNPADYADWEARITRPGRFQVLVEAAGLAPTSIEIAAGGKKLSGPIEPTGDYGKFKTFTLGTLEVPSSGLITLSVRAVRDGWQPLNVRSVRLQPVSS